MRRGVLPRRSARGRVGTPARGRSGARALVRPAGKGTAAPAADQKTASDPIRPTHKRDKGARLDRGLMTRKA